MTSPGNTGAAYKATANSLTLREDLARVAKKVDVLTGIVETAPGKASSTTIAATRAGNTWTIPAPLSSYQRGNRPNTWRISLSGTPPKDVTWHTSINQTFVRETEITEGQGRTYPPTTRR